MCVCVCKFFTLSLLTQYLKRGNCYIFILGILMPHIDRKKSIAFGKAERSSGVIGDQTLVTRYLEMAAWIHFIRRMCMVHGERENPVMFSGGQRSSGNTGGQYLNLLTWCLKSGNLGIDIILCMWIPRNPVVRSGGQRSSGVTGSN